MRIDSSGNLLVGTTTVNPGVGNTATGVQAGGSILAASRSGNVPAFFNRNTSDGNIVQFAKDGATVGSIGVSSSNAYISGTTRGLHFTGTAGIIPCNEAGAARDADTNLGTSSTRFKDLYLSGGVYLGGTAGANHLDDYEEGTFSGTVDGSSYDGHYTKVGRIVHISVEITNTTATGNRIASLPFSARNGVTAPNGTQATRNTRYSLDDMYFAPYNGGATIYAYNKTGGTQGTVSGGDVSLNFVYETDD
jgi:hypothetical protein